MEILKENIHIEETLDTLFSIIIYDKKVLDVVKYLEEQLDKSKKITNPIKKNKINNRLFNFIQYINNNYNELSNINSIFLINDKIIEYKLKIKDIETANTYNIPKIFIKNDYKFYIEYFIDIFNNFEFIYTIKIIKNDANIIKINKNKEKNIENLKIINENKIYEVIENIRKNNNYKDFIIIYGTSNIINKIDDIKNIIIKKELFGRFDLYKFYEDEMMLNNHQLLEKKLEDLKNENTNIDLYVFGKLKFEIKDAIESYSIKELYIEDKKLDKLKTFIDDNFLNFKIITIRSLENGDIGDNFIKNYNGIMGIKYY
jgi:hypothetical protein